MAKITVPTNKSYTGIDFGVPFVNGVAETEDAWLITMFKEKGYHVEETTTEEAPEEVAEEVEPEPKKKAPARKTTKEG